MITPAVPDPPEIERVLWEGFSSARISYDIGANCGQTIPKILSFSETVVAFEPAEEAFEYLVATFLNPIVGLSHLAVSSRTGTVELMAAPSKIATGQLVTHGTEGMEWSADEVENGVVRTLDCITLDDYIDRTHMVPDFVKIDVEGHELDVLLGAEKLINSRPPEMLIEIHSEKLGRDVEAMLRPFYRLETVRHPHYAEGSPLFRTHFWYKCFPKVDIF